MSSTATSWRRSHGRRGPARSLQRQLYNLSLIANNTPRKVLLETGLNPDLWYPPHRYLYGGLQFCVRNAANINMETGARPCARRFNVRCGSVV